jgi:hypothetical protein
MRCGLRLLLLGCLLASPVHAAEKLPSFARDVQPILSRYCLECHSGRRTQGDLDLSTHKAITVGGKSGNAFEPGKPDVSLGLRMMERKAKPFMPPKDKKQPTKDEIAVVRAWIAAGAKDEPSETTVLPPKAPAAPVTAVAYRPDGKLLAAAGHREVLLLDAAGEITAKLAGLPPRVTALAFSRDGNRLAVGAGEPGALGEVRLFSFDAGKVRSTPDHTLTAHTDLIHDLAFSPDGRLLATTGYDRLIKLWEVATGKEVRTLKDHSDAVYGLAFRPDGKLLASAAADRAVKVWDVASGRRLYTLGEATDWLYAIAWSPDGKSLAAGGIDRSIRIWDVEENGGRIVHSVFAHEGPVLRLVYAADGSRLYSLSEDRSAKAWDAAKMSEVRVYPKQPEATLALGVRPDHKQLALGRYDGALLLCDEETGKTQSQPLPAKPKPPKLDKLTPSSGPRGQALRFKFEGTALDSVTDVIASQPGVTAKLLPDTRTAAAVEAEVTFPATAPAGVYTLLLKGAAGQTEARPFTLDLFAATADAEPNESPRTGQVVKLPVTAVGIIDKAGDVDYYRFEAKAGQQLGVQAVTAPVGSELEGVIVLADSEGRQLAEGRGGVLGYTFATAGSYAVGIRDGQFRGGPKMTYRMHLGDVPVVTSLFPLGVQRGAEAEIAVEGVHLGDVRSVKVQVKPDVAPGTKVPVAVETPRATALGPASVTVGEFPESQTVGMLAIPGTGNGRVAPSAADVWRFTARKGQRLIVEVNARRLGSSLDSFVEILDAQGRPLSAATLRCVAKTNTVFRDHDSAAPGIRIEAWSELAINDYLYVGGELVRIRQLPKNPDDDCQFFQTGGQRLGFLGTTPEHHPVGQPMYKVTIHPPGTQFPPNGMPLFTLPYRNDDGGPGLSKDSRLVFDPPADGEYRVRVGDVRGQGGPEYGYRLTVRLPRPDFRVSFNPTAPSVWKGGAVPVSVTAERIDGFDDAIELRLLNLPAGLSAPATTIPAGEQTTAFALFAEPNATVPAGAAALKLAARAVLGGTDVLRESAGGVPKVVEPGDLVTVTDQSEVTVKPGGEVRLTVKIERRNGFKGRVPLDVRGLPHGVRVLDIGLNGVLITERETARTIAIYCEPWVKPTDHPFVVLARREGKNTEHAARSVLLRVAPARP